MLVTCADCRDPDGPRGRQGGSRSRPQGEEDRECIQVSFSYSYLSPILSIYLSIYFSIKITLIVVCVHLTYM